MVLTVGGGAFARSGVEPPAGAVSSATTETSGTATTTAASADDSSGVAIDTAALDDISTDARFAVAAGGETGLEAFNATIGLTDTDVSSTWGLTQTTPADQVMLLAAVLSDGSADLAAGTALVDQVVEAAFGAVTAPTAI